MRVYNIETINRCHKRTCIFIPRIATIQTESKQKGIIGMHRPGTYQQNDN